MLMKWSLVTDRSENCCKVVTLHPLVNCGAKNAGVAGQVTYIDKTRRHFQSIALKQMFCLPEGVSPAWDVDGFVQHNVGFGRHQATQ